MEQDIVVKTFPDLSGTNFNSLRQVNLYGVFARVIIGAKTGDLLSRSKLEAIRDLDTSIRSITAISDSGENITVKKLQYVS